MRRFFAKIAEGINFENGGKVRRLTFLNFYLRYTQVVTLSSGSKYFLFAYCNSRFGLCMITRLAVKG